MIDPTNKEEIEKFFQLTEGLTQAEQAVLANVSTQTIGNWRRKIGLKSERHSNFIPGPAKKEEFEILPEEVWNNKEWFRQAYEKYGVRKIGRMIGRDRFYVMRKLESYKIPRKYRFKRVKSKNPFCNPEWLMYHYGSREDYLNWCEENDVEPCEYGGQTMTLAECASLAGVVSQTIVNWLAKFGFKTRSTSEARRGRLNHYHDREVPIEEKRLIRKLIFENYRKGKRIFRIGKYNFSNGRLLGTSKDLSQKNYRGSRSQP